MKKSTDYAHIAEPAAGQDDDVDYAPEYVIVWGMLTIAIAGLAVILYWVFR